MDQQLIKQIFFCRSKSLPFNQNLPIGWKLCCFSLFFSTSQTINLSTPLNISTITVILTKIHLQSSFFGKMLLSNINLSILHTYSNRKCTHTRHTQTHTYSTTRTHTHTNTNTHTHTHTNKHAHTLTNIHHTL